MDKGNVTPKSWMKWLSGIAFLVFLAIHGIVLLVREQFPTIVKADSPTAIDLPHEEEEDDFRLGKSCVYNNSNKKKHSDVEHWVCRECSSEDGS